MMNRILYPIVCFFVLIFQPGQLTSQTVLSMDECVRKALAQDLQRQIAGLQLSIAGTNNHGSVAGRYPTIRLNTAGQGNLNDQNNPASFLNGLIRSGNANLSLDATWLVFNGFRVRYNLKQLGTLEEQARVRLNLTGLQTVRRVMLAYLQEEWQEAQVGLAREVLGLSRDLLAYQELRREFGQSLTQQVLQSRDAVWSDSSLVVSANLNLAVARNALKLAMGDPTMSDFDVDGALNLPVQVWDRDALQQLILTQNPQIQEAVLGEQVAAIQTRMTQSAFYPQFGINAGGVLSGTVTSLDGNNPFTGEPFGTQTGSNRNLYFGVTGSWPIYDAGVRRRQVTVNRLQEQIASVTRQALSDQLQSQLDDLLITYQTHLMNLSIQDEQVANARQNLDMAEEKFRLGQLSIFDLRTVQLNAAQAAQRRITTIYQLRVLEVEILSLTGQLVR
ncbi:MAG: TolC family protein [Saprospiraceae bacterium]|nr:TolC family protein [Saprospiraceae bacterium]